MGSTLVPGGAVMRRPHAGRRLGRPECGGHWGSRPVSHPASLPAIPALQPTSPRPSAASRHAGGRQPSSQEWPVGHGMRRHLWLGATLLGSSRRTGLAESRLQCTPTSHGSPRRATAPWSCHALPAPLSLLGAPGDPHSGRKLSSVLEWVCLAGTDGAQEARGAEGQALGLAAASRGHLLPPHGARRIPV